MTLPLILALLIGVVTGLRTMTAPAAVSWAASLGWLDLSATWLAFLGYRWTPWIVTVLAIGEFIADQLPSTPSRKIPLQFGGRIVVGGLCGGAICMGEGLAMLLGLVAGVAGAVVGTLGGAAARGRMAAAFGSDRPAAFLEDAVAIGAAVLIVLALR